jgi:hypothetical protein
MTVSEDGKWPTYADGFAALRVEWCKAIGHARRYTEDIRILCAEMRRTIAFGHAAAAKWDIHAEEELLDAEQDLTEGRRTYTAEHVDTEHRTCVLLEKNWGLILRCADAYLDNTQDSREAGPETGTDMERWTYVHLEREWEALQR